MSDSSVDILKEALGDDEDGLKSIFEKWNKNGDWSWELRWSKDNEMMVVLTDKAAEVIEVFEIDIKRLI